jgi:hypothetical protein
MRTDSESTGIRFDNMYIAPWSRTYYLGASGAAYSGAPLHEAYEPHMMTSAAAFNPSACSPLSEAKRTVKT